MDPILTPHPPRTPRPYALKPGAFAGMPGLGPAKHSQLHATLAAVPQALSSPTLCLAMPNLAHQTEAFWKSCLQGTLEGLVTGRPCARTPRARTRSRGTNDFKVIASVPATPCCPGTEHSRHLGAARTEGSGCILLIPWSAYQVVVPMTVKFYV